MKPCITALLSVVAALVFSPSSYADDKETIEKLQKEIAELRRQMAASDVQLKLARKELDEAKKAVELFEKEITALRNERDALKNNPLNKLDSEFRAEVLAVNNDSSLVVVNVGSDSGLQPGHEVQIYRNTKDPKAPTLIGKLKITRVEPKQAVGKFTSTNDDKTKPEKGDAALMEKKAK